MSPLFSLRNWLGFLRVLRAERRRVSFRLLGSAFAALVRPVPAKVYQDRLEICRGCVLHDAKLQRCGPSERPELGCRCFTPFLALERKACWGREHLPGQGVGWDGFNH